MGGRPSYQKNGRARNRQRPLAAIVSVRAHDKTLKVLEGPSQPSDCPPFHGRPAAFPLERSSRALLARRRRSAPSWPGRAHCSQSQSCARCVTSSASGGTYAAYSSACCTDAAAVQTMASRWSDIFEREPEHEPELGPSNEPGPQPDSWFADKVEDVPPMQATQAPQPEAEFQDGIEVEEEVILCAGLLPGAQIAERVGRALALLARTKVRSPARPRARHPAPCPAPRSPCPRAPLSALARRSRYSPCPPVPLAGARRPRPQAPRMRGRGAGAARARASQAGWCFCGDLAACEAAAAAESPAAAAISLPPCACACACVCVTSQKCFSCLTHTRALGRAGGRAGAFRPPVVIILSEDATQLAS